MNIFSKAFASLCFSLAIATAATLAWAQPYPSKPITIVNPFPPGGTADFVGRLVAQKLGDTAGWRVIVDNKQGATGQIGAKFVASAAPDGYTVLLGPSSTHATGPAVFRNLPYDVLRDFIGVTPVIGGDVQMVFENISGAVPNIKGGRLRAIAVTSARRDPVLPDVPTLLEAGMPGFETLLSWFSIFAPAATPREIVNRLNTEIVKVLNLPEVRDLMLARGLEPRPMAVEQFNAQWRSDLQRYAAIAKKANISLD